jgi:hypothetical protein
MKYLRFWKRFLAFLIDTIPITFALALIAYFFLGFDEVLHRYLRDIHDLEAKAGPPSFDGKVSGLVAFLAFHETYHVGQVSYLKKWLGCVQTVG